MTGAAPLRQVVVVGGGVAAQRCAMELRKSGFEGRIVVVSAEQRLPYDRTLLSKDFLVGTVPDEHLTLAAPADYEALGIELRLGVAATALDASARQVVLADGTRLAYDRLVIATGGKPVRPPALANPRAYVLRDLDGAERLRDALRNARSVVIVGGGFIGGEVAAAALALGVAVTLVEALDAPLARAVGLEAGSRIAELHRAHGVRLLTGTRAGAIRTTPSGAEVVLTDGRVLGADAVVVGAGMVPETAWLEGSGLRLDDGVVTDAHCRTVVPDVLAAGDGARWWNPRYGKLMRAEHWDTATRHGVAAARNALDDARPFAPVPYFWSSQHGVRFQWIGDATGWDAVEIEDLDPPRSFIARFHREGRLQAVLAAGRPRAIADARLELEAAQEVAA